MRVFVAGATGVIGRQLVPMLVAGGHEVTGMTRSPERARELVEAGAQAAVADALDAGAVSAAVATAHPDAVIHQLTSLPQRIDPRRIKRDFEMNDRLRSEGTRILVDAAQAAGASRVIAQSIALAYAPGPDGTIHDEDDPLFVGAPEPFTRTALALQALESAVTDAGGVVLRYGYFYGPGSALSSTGSMVKDVVRRRMPIVGAATGVWSFIHVHDAASATVAALARDGPRIYNVVDDEPAPVSQWLPELAKALDARPPRRVPAWLARLIAGSFGVQAMLRQQGASNARARRELDWAPRFPSWREGFASSLG